MARSQSRNTRAVLAIIAMLAASPLTVTYAQAEVTDENDGEISKSVKMTGGERVKVVLAERIVDGRLQVCQFDVAEDASSDEIRRALTLEGKTTGWAYVSGKAYNSGIVLFDGKAIKIDERSWDPSSEGKIEAAKRTLDSDLRGEAHGYHVISHGTAANDDLGYRIVLSGNIVQSGEADIFAVAFAHTGLKDPESGPSVELIHSGQLEVRSPEGDRPTTDSFKKSVSAA